MISPHPYLDSLNNFEAFLHKVKPDDFHIGRVKEVLTLLNNPHEGLNVIHVAGTKGKGSTCMMIASILATTGLKVGLYTSPHLHRVNERIRVLTHSNLHQAEDFPGSITDQELELLISKVRGAIAVIENKGGFITYFEALTILAAMYFKEKQVDWVVLETGLGGRLDATNVFSSKIAVLTPISLDHTKILGDSIAKIACEKAGIIKSSHQQVVVAPQDPDALSEIKKKCNEYGIVPQQVHPMQYKQLMISLKGEHQIINASCALEVIQLLIHEGANISTEAINDGLKYLRWQGRFEILKTNPDIIVDGAHNHASAQALAKTLRDEYRKKKIITILGISSDKDIRSICDTLKIISKEIILTKASHSRSHEFTTNEAKEIFADKQFYLTQNVTEAIKLARCKTSKEDVIVITGSLFVVAEARECINSKN